MAKPGADIDALMKRQAKVEEEMERAGGYAIDHRIDETLHGLGFTDDQFGILVSKMSGGQRARVGLARLLLEQPDLLLLDEPTNHLDIEGRRWLERFLGEEYPGAVVLVSHDRRLLDRVVQEFERMTPAPAVTVYKNYDPAVRPLALDAEWMERVVLNLLVNAAQASSSGSVVTLRTRQVSGAETEIAVIDRGSGVAPEHRGSIFNPFFTTKKEGVGLGLAIVAKIVDEHGGRLEFDSEPGRGSVFRLLLPAVAGA